MNHVGQFRLKLTGQDTTGSDIVAVAEASGQAQDLRVRNQAGRFDQLIDVLVRHPSTRFFKSKSGFLIAVGAGRSKDQYVGLRHSSVGLAVV